MFWYVIYLINLFRIILQVVWLFSSDGFFFKDVDWSCIVCFFFLLRRYLFDFIVFVFLIVVCIQWYYVRLSLLYSFLFFDFFFLIRFCGILFICINILFSFMLRFCRRLLGLLVLWLFGLNGINIFSCGVFTCFVSFFRNKESCLFFYLFYLRLIGLGEKILWRD